MPKHISLHSHSPSFDAAIKKLKRQPAAQLRFLSVASDKLYAASAWKQLFLIALKRLARVRPEAARLTAIEGLVVFSPVSFSNIERPRASIAQLREVAAILQHSKRRPLRGATTPRLSGLHPDILCSRYEEALQCFRHGDSKDMIGKLWRQWGGQALPTSTTADGKERNLLHVVQSENNASEKSILLLAASLRSTKPVVRNALSRAGALRARPGYCPSCKFRKRSENLQCCSVCWTRACSSQVNAALK